MNESNFNQLIDDTLLAIEEAIDQLETDIDYDTVAGILTVELANHSKIIINRQIANHQLWLAAKSGGYHFNWIHKQWLETKSGLSLSEVLSKNLTMQANQNIILSIQPK